MSPLVHVLSIRSSKNMPINHYLANYDKINQQKVFALVAAAYPQSALDKFELHSELTYYVSLQEAVIQMQQMCCDQVELIHEGDSSRAAYSSSNWKLAWRLNRDWKDETAKKLVRRNKVCGLHAVFQTDPDSIVSEPYSTVDLAGNLSRALVILGVSDRRGGIRRICKDLHRVISVEYLIGALKKQQIALERDLGDLSALELILSSQSGQSNQSNQSN
jgi:hypothetical protein